MKTQHVINCSFSSWYSTFKNITIKSRILDIPPSVLKYLQSDDTVVLPKSTEYATASHFTRGSDDDDNEKLDTDWDEEDSTEVEPPHFPEFESEIERNIKALGGSVFPKLNWSSPKDASWIAMNKNLRCNSVADILLLLKSSEFVTHDLTQPFLQCDDYSGDEVIKYQLVLRRWHDLNVGGEFRCFIKNNKLWAICQRHHSSFFDFIGPQRNDIVNDLEDFFNRELKGNFPDTSYVIDVFRKEQSKVYLVDINPYGSVTDALLFTWDELEDSKRPMPMDNDVENDDNKPCFRYVQEEAGVQPSPYQSFGLPQDFLDLNRGTDPDKLIDFLKLQCNTQDESEDR